MAQYAPQANALSDEQEYLQAYEDVLEKYKGRGDLWGGGGGGGGASGWRRYGVIAAWRFSKCQPHCPPPHLWSLDSGFIPAVEKWECFLHDITFCLNFNRQDKDFTMPPPPSHYNWHYLLSCWVCFTFNICVTVTFMPDYYTCYCHIFWVCQRLTFLTRKESINLYLGWLLTGLPWAKWSYISYQRFLSPCQSLMPVCVAAPGEPIALIRANPSHVKDLCCSLSLWQLDTHAAWGHACGAKFKLTAAPLTLSSPHKDSKEL